MDSVGTNSVIPSKKGVTTTTTEASATTTAAAVEKSSGHSHNIQPSHQQQQPPPSSKQPPPSQSSSSVPDDSDEARRRKRSKPKRKLENNNNNSSSNNNNTEGGLAKPKPKSTKRSNKDPHSGSKKPRSHNHNPTSKARGASSSSSSSSRYFISPAQQAVNEQMRRALEDAQYSAAGSIVDSEDDDDDDDHHFHHDNVIIRIDRPALLSAMRKRIFVERIRAGNHAPNANNAAAANSEDGTGRGRGGAATPADTATAAQPEESTKKKQKKTRRKEDGTQKPTKPEESTNLGLDDPEIMELRDESSIFGQTTGSSNATWVECDKCKKWRRLRGVVDEKKLPPKWYCSMNKNDPERARCSAPEEEYDAPMTPESAADARIRKHLRVWVRRLESNETFEARQPNNLTRGKRRSTQTNNTKEPYEWVRCCNPSCGKWRALLRFMDANHHVIDKTTNGEWYCVMNNWDEKIASCAAPQETLPALGCPPWAMPLD